MEMISQPPTPFSVLSLDLSATHYIAMMIHVSITDSTVHLMIKKQNWGLTT